MPMYNHQQQINFYLDDFKPVLIKLPLKQVFFISVIIALMLSAFGVWEKRHISHQEKQLHQLSQQQQQLQTNLTTLQSSYNPIAIDMALQQRITELENTLDNKALIQSYLYQQQPITDFSFSAILSSLANGHQEGVWLTKITILSRNNHYQLHGKTYNAALIPLYLQKLQQQKTLIGGGFTVFDIRQDEDDERLLHFVLGRKKTDFDVDNTAILPPESES